MSEAITDAKVRNGRRTVFAVVAGLMMIWGVALWLYNALFFKFSEFFSFQPVHIAWTLALFHVAYFMLAIPASLFHRQFGYKLGFLFGLSVFALGAFLLYLAIIQHSSFYFVAAVMVIGSSGAWLDTSLNPLVVEAGKPETAVWRLNFAHSFNAVGLFAGYLTAIWLIERHYQLTIGATAHLSARPYVLVGLGAILLAFLVEQISLPSFASRASEKTGDIAGELRQLLSDRTFRIAAASLCAYTVVLTALWTSNYNYRSVELPGHAVAIFERGSFWFLIGRLAAPLLMRWINPLRVLAGCAALCLGAIAVTAAAGGMTGWVCLLSASLFLSIAYPTIFASAICRHPTHLKLAGGVMAAAAGLGNAISCLLVALALHDFNINARIVIVLALPFAGAILVYALTALKKPAPASPA